MQSDNSALEDLYKSIQTFGSIQMAAESRDKLYRYNNALMESIHSILEDGDCDEAVKLETFNTTMEQYTAAMRELFPKLLSGQPAREQKTAVGKSDPGRFVSIVEVEKFNPYHDSKGRFASANSAASFTYSPGKSNAHDKAIARERERQAAAATPAAASGPKAMDLDEYLGTKGLASDVDDFMLDKLRNPHGMTQRQQAKLQRDAKASSDDYHARRQAAIDEYNRKVESGELRPKTKVERLLQTAQGHDDNPSVQAARRLLDKRGIDWKTGETKKSVEKADTDAIVRIEEVEKFNPYHDSLGRFSSANAAASFTHRTRDPNKQHWADAAIAREKERDDKGLNGPSSKNPLQNPESLGGAERGDPMTRSQANNNRVNPNYFLEPGYRTNCQSCVVAFEARLRGYDVQTKPMKRGSMLDQLAHDTRLAWKDPRTGEKPEFIKDSSVTTPKKCRDWLEKTIQPGQRYTLQNSWKGRSRSGHIISADKDEHGALRLYDPQSGKTYKGSDIDGYLNKCKYTMTVLGTKINVAPKLTRVDNMSINTSVANYIMEAKAS